MVRGAVAIVVDAGAAVVASGVDIVAVTGSDDAAGGMVISSFLGARITNFNTRGRVTANIIRTIEDMRIILVQRYCHRLPSILSLALYSLYNGLYYILCSLKT